MPAFGGSDREIMKTRQQGSAGETNLLTQLQTLSPQLQVTTAWLALPFLLAWSFVVRILVPLDVLQCLTPDTGMLYTWHIAVGSGQ